MSADPAVTRLAAIYRRTAPWYDLLDAWWERRYRRWRPKVVGDVTGSIIEAGVGTGRNLRWYPAGADVLGVDFSAGMLARARRRSTGIQATVSLQEADATRLAGIADSSMDWYIATFLYCVLPDEIQPAALREMARVLKLGGRFRIVEVVWSRNPLKRTGQRLLAPIVERLYGARFDRRTREHLQATDGLTVTSESFLEADTYLLLEGRRSG